MRSFILLLALVCCGAEAKQFKIIADLGAPYFFYRYEQQPAGIFKDILDHAFKGSEHSFLLIGADTHTMLLALKTKEYDGYLTLPKFIPVDRPSVDPFANTYKRKVLLGLFTLYPMTTKPLKFTQPYDQTFASKKIGALHGFGFNKLLQRDDLITYRYLQVGTQKLLNNEIDLLIEEPLLISCPPDPLLSSMPSPSKIYVHYPPYATAEMYIGVKENLPELEQLIRKGVKKVNLNSLQPKYEEFCRTRNRIKMIKVNAENGG